MGDTLRPIGTDDLDVVMADLLGPGGFADELAARRHIESDTGSILVSGDELVVLDRWRDDLPYLAIRGLWCTPSRVPRLVDQIEGIARERGFSRVLSPLVDPLGSRPYQRAGMEPFRRVRQMRRRAVPVAPDPRFSVEEGTPDLGALAEIEAEAFEPFWRLDARHLAEHAEVGRVSWVRDGAVVVGYALALHRGDTGSIGRMAVRRSWCRRGIGRALLREAMGHLCDQGVRELVLNTQADNRAAAGLYRSEGFREVHERLVVLASATLS